VEFGQNGRPAIDGKRICHFSMVNGHLSFDRCKLLAILLEEGVTSASGKMTIDK